MMRRLGCAMMLVCACSAPPSTGTDTAVKAVNATEVGPFGYVHTNIRVDVGERSGGLTSWVDALLIQPASLDDSAAPFVLLLPEQDVAKEAYGYTGYHLASWGFAVVIPQLTTGASPRTDAEMVGDVLKIVATIGKGGVATDINSNQSIVALAGHGRGGRIALLAAQKQDNPSAVFLLSPRDGDGGGAGISVVPERAASLTYPVGIYGAARAMQTAEGETEACVPRAQSYKTIYPELRGVALLVEATKGGHGDLLDTCVGGASDLMCSTTCVAGERPEDAINVARGSMAAFFGYHLRNNASLGMFFDTSYLTDLLPGVRLRRHEAGVVDTGALVDDTALP